MRTAPGVQGLNPRMAPAGDPASDQIDQVQHPAWAWQPLAARGSCSGLAVGVQPLVSQ